MASTLAAKMPKNAAAIGRANSTEALTIIDHKKPSALQPNTLAIDVDGVALELSLGFNVQVHTRATKKFI